MDIISKVSSKAIAGRKTDDLSEDLIKLIPDLKTLFKDEIKINDKFSFEKSYLYNPKHEEEVIPLGDKKLPLTVRNYISEGTPPSLAILIHSLQTKYSLGEKNTFSCLVGYYGRTASTVIHPPKGNYIIRVLVNMGYNEVYSIASNKDRGKDENKDKNGDEKISSYLNGAEKIFMPKNTATVIGPSEIGEKIIVVGSNPKQKVPQLPAGADTNGVKRPGGVLRPRSYDRITVIIDLSLSPDMINKMMKEYEKMKSMPQAKSTLEALEKYMKSMNLTPETLNALTQNHIQNNPGDQTPTQEIPPIQTTQGQSIETQNQIPLDQTQTLQIDELEGEDDVDGEDEAIEDLLRRMKSKK